jgi:hypothetical protein
MESGYQQEPVAGGGVRFTVTPAPAPRATGSAIAVAVLLGLSIALVPIPGGAGHPAFRLLIGGAAGAAAFRLAERWLTRRADRSRAPGGSFVVSALGIETRSTRLPRGRLKRLMVTNVVRGSAGTTGVVAGKAYREAPELSPKLARSAREAVSYRLSAEEEDRSITLAGGMTALTAHGLLTEVSRILSRG